LKYEESKYIGYDGKRMYMAVWKPDDDRPRALMIAIHGLGSHGNDLRTIGEYFAEKGIAVFAPDMRGFGHYDGIRGHVMRYDEYVEDLHNIVMQVKDRYLNKLTFLFGASLGGLTAIRYVATYPRLLDGLLLHCPAVAQNRDVSKGKFFLAQILSALNVKREFSDEMTYEDGSRNPEAVKRHQKDPLRWNFVTPRFGVETLKAVKEAFKWGPRILVPVLYQQAGDDKMVSPERSKEFFDSIASVDKTWRLYDGLYHELHEEPEQEIVLGEMAGWLETRLPS
jgi:alpha-beta hydrolase superfamily lysophospholipase